MSSPGDSQVSGNITDDMRERLADGRLIRQCSQNGQNWIDCPIIFKDLALDCCAPYKRYVAMPKTCTSPDSRGVHCVCWRGGDPCCLCEARSPTAEQPETSPEAWQSYHGEPRPLAPYAARLVPPRRNPQEPE